MAPAAQLTLPCIIYLHLIVPDGDISPVVQRGRKVGRKLSRLLRRLPEVACVVVGRLHGVALNMGRVGAGWQWVESSMPSVAAILVANACVWDCRGWWGSRYAAAGAAT